MENINLKHPVLKTVLAMLVVAAIAGTAVVAMLRDRLVNPYRYQVSFTAEGKIFAKPDIAQITLGVTTDRRATAVKAVQDNTELMNKVITKLKELGVADKDIKTTSYNLNPSYDYVQSTGRSEIMGYEVYQNVDVKIRELDKIGDIIEGATSVGANQVGNISFTIDDLSEIKKLARQEAITKAQEKAEEMAQFTGLKLGKLINVYESDSYQPPVLYSNFAKDVAYGMGGSESASPDVQVGQNEVGLSVTLTFEVK